MRENRTSGSMRGCRKRASGNAPVFYSTRAPEDHWTEDRKLSDFRIGYIAYLLDGRSSPDPFSRHGREKGRKYWGMRW